MKIYHRACDLSLSSKYLAEEFVRKIPSQNNDRMMISLTMEKKNRTESSFVAML
jgi:purine-nucleoside phosphorylase